MTLVYHRYRSRARYICIKIVITEEFATFHDRTQRPTFTPWCHRTFAALIMISKGSPARNDHGCDSGAFIEDCVAVIDFSVELWPCFDSPGLICEESQRSRVAVVCYGNISPLQRKFRGSFASRQLATLLVIGACAMPECSPVIRNERRMSNTHTTRSCLLA
jgi:hypothetical protein